MLQTMGRALLFSNAPSQIFVTSSLSSFSNMVFAITIITFTLLSFFLKLHAFTSSKRKYYTFPAFMCICQDSGIVYSILGNK